MGEGHPSQGAYPTFTGSSLHNQDQGGNYNRNDRTLALKPHNSIGVGLNEQTQI